MSALGTIEVVGAAAPVSDDQGEGSQEPVDYKVKASIFWDEMVGGLLLSFRFDR